jgi:PAS domain S-box-containing protein
MSERLTHLAALLRDIDAPFATEEEAWDGFVRKSASYMGCHSVSYFEADPDKKTLTFKKAIGPVGADLVGLSFGYQGIVGFCAESGETLVVNDALNDPRFTKKVDKGSGFVTKAALALPCFFGGKLGGVLEYINPMQGAFSPEDAAFAEAALRHFCQRLYVARLEATVSQLNARGESTINNLSGGFIGVDQEGKIIFFNPKARDILGTDEEFVGRKIIELFNTCPDLVNALGDVLKTGRTVRRQEFKCQVNGSGRVIGYSSINMKGPDGGIVGAGVIFQDITDL